MNLGAFAGGLARGMGEAQDRDLRERDFQARQENAKAQREEMAANRNLRERQIAISEEDQKFQRKQREEQEATRKGLEELYGSIYGQDKSPGQDTTLDAKYFAGVMKLNASRMPPDQIMKIGQTVSQLQNSEKGKVVMSILEGDQSAIPKFADLAGKTGQKGALEIKPFDGVFQIKWQDGSTTDLKAHATARGFADAMKFMEGSSKDARDAASAKNDVRKTDAYVNAQGAAAADHRAGANLKGAQVESVKNGGTTRGTGGKTVDKVIQDAVKMVFPRDTKALDQKAPDAAREFVLGRASEIHRAKKITPNEAVSTAAQEWRRVAGEADARITSLRKAGKKPEDYGARSWEDVRIQAITQKLGAGAGTNTDNTDF